MRFGWSLVEVGQELNGVAHTFTLGAGEIDFCPDRDRHPLGLDLALERADVTTVYDDDAAA